MNHRGLLGGFPFLTNQQNMKLFTYDEANLQFKPVSAWRAFRLQWTFALILLLVSLSSAVMLKMMNDNLSLMVETGSMLPEREVIVIQKYNEFTPEKLDQMLDDMNFKFPHIVKAQAILETGNFTSRMFKENNNLFGMKRSTLRPTTHRGEKNGHAYYDTFRDSVIDYALYQARYLSSIKTDEEYLFFLSRSYAEDPEYVNKLLKIMGQ